jgi:hypothetical protein
MRPLLVATFFACTFGLTTSWTAFFTAFLGTPFRSLAAWAFHATGTASGQHATLQVTDRFALVQFLNGLAQAGLLACDLFKATLETSLHRRRIKHPRLALRTFATTRSALGRTAFVALGICRRATFTRLRHRKTCDYR